MVRIGIGLMLVWVGVSGCSSERSGEPQAQEQPLKVEVSSPPTTPELPDGAQASKAPIKSQVVKEGDEPFEKKPDVRGTLNVKEIDWEAARAHAKLDDALIPDEVKAQLQDVVVPALLPANEALLASAKITKGPHWYAASMDDGQHSIYIQGSRTSVEFGQIELDKAGDALTKRPYMITRTHQIVTIAFERFGAGYGVDIECRKPMTDERCTKDAYAHELMAAMGVAGGGAP